MAANWRRKRYHWQLFALSTLSFSVSIENSGFKVSTPFFFLQKKFISLFKMSTMHVDHSRVAVDLEKILQCGSAESKKALFFLLAKTFFRASRHEECLIVAFRGSRVNCSGSRIQKIVVGSKNGTF